MGCSQHNRPLPKYIGEYPYDLTKFDMNMEILQFMRGKDHNELEAEPILNNEILREDGRLDTVGLEISRGFVTDSVAFLGDIYYNGFKVMTTPDSTFVALWVESKAGEETNPDFYLSTLEKLTTLYGAPLINTEPSDTWGTRYMVWDLSDRILQFEISSGVQASFSTNGEQGFSGKYYDSEVLIIDKKQIEKVRVARNIYFGSLCEEYFTPDIQE